MEVLARDSAEHMDNIKSTVEMLNIFETINYGVFRRLIVSILDVNTKTKIEKKKNPIVPYLISGSLKASSQLVLPVVCSCRQVSH